MTFREPPIPRPVLSLLLLREISLPATPRRSEARRIALQITSILLKHDCRSPSSASLVQAGFRRKQ